MINIINIILGYILISYIILIKYIIINYIYIYVIYIYIYIYTQQTIYSTLLDALRLKVKELIRRFDDNLRPKASNCSILL